MGIEAWAEKHGEKPQGAGTAAEWFTEHPDVREEARTIRADRWSWRQITDYLVDEYAYPFCDPEAVAKECK